MTESLRDALERVMGLLGDGYTTWGPWEASESCDYTTHWEVCDCGGPSTTGKTKVIAPVQDYCMAAEDDAAAIVAMHSLLRERGAELLAAIDAHLSGAGTAGERE